MHKQGKALNGRVELRKESESYSNGTVDQLVVSYASQKAIHTSSSEDPKRAALGLWRGLLIPKVFSHFHWKAYLSIPTCL